MQVSDILLTATFMNQGRTQPINLVFGIISMLLILIPLVLTALFITRSQMRKYVRRRYAAALRAARGGVGAEEFATSSLLRSQAQSVANGMEDESYMGALLVL